LALAMVVVAAKTAERIRLEVFMVGEWIEVESVVVVGSILRVMQMLRYRKRSFEIVSRNRLGVGRSPTRLGSLPIHTREHESVQSTSESFGVSVIDDLLSVLDIIRGSYDWNPGESSYCKLVRTYRYITECVKSRSVILAVIHTWCDWLDSFLLRDYGSWHS
jgi:hypothetical protein